MSPEPKEAGREQGAPQGFTAAQREVAMRACWVEADRILGRMIPSDTYNEDGSLIETPPEVVIKTADLLRMGEAMGRIWQNIQANPPLLPADSWRGVRVIHEDMPRSDDQHTSILQIEFPNQRIFRKSFAIAGSGAANMKNIGEALRMNEILRDAIYWLAGECKPVTPKEIPHAR